MAEKFISDCTKNCSNEQVVCGSHRVDRIYSPWLTPDQARKAVEIAREEIYEWLKKNAYSYTWCDYLQHERGMEIGKLIKDIKQVMKDE